MMSGVPPLDGAPMGAARPDDELESLRSRLAEAEATLEAIREGSVDALVVASGSGGDQVEIRTILDLGSLGDSLFNQVTQPIFILDGSGRILRSNQPAQELCGFNPSSRLFSEALQLRPLEDGKADGKTDEKTDGKPGGKDALGDWIAERRHIAALDVYLECPELGTRFYLLDANPVTLSWEGYEGGIVTLTDITDRKLAEIQLSVKSAQLSHQFNLLKSISDNIPEGLILTDEDGKIVFQNPAALKLLGLTAARMLGRELNSVFRIGKGPDEPYAPAEGAAVADGVSRIGCMMGHGGRRTMVQYAFFPVNDGQRVRGDILVLSDITERLATERQLRQSLEKQQQSQKMEAIGRLAGGIAHDFNNLLLAILGFTELSLGRVVPDDPVHGNLVEVKKAGERAAALTGQLLAYSRKQMLAPAPGLVNSAIEDVRKMIERLIGEKIRLRVELSREELWSEIDQPKLQQVLINMVLNAKDAMPGGGELIIRTKRLDVRSHDTSGMVGEILRDTVDGLPPGGYAVIGIEDTGHGMDGAVMERLFEPFFTTKEFGKGSGLGLSTAYGIVRQLGGYLQVFSDPGRGSHFKVMLPLSKKRPAALYRPQAAQSAVPEGNGRLILLVEDEDVVRRLLSKVLKDQGYRVLEARNGEDALAKLPKAGNRLALIVTDLVMDGMGGVELAEHLARKHPGVEILFMSGYAQDHHSPPKVGKDKPHFASKPFRPVEFLAKIRSILEPALRIA
jgi:two-component system, cell cycle sensor histidine kinase and response regulator CckA